MLKLVSELECLCSLSRVITNSHQQMCCPEFITTGQVFDAIQLRHPCVHSQGKQDVIANDIRLDKTILLSGPNMGGKSTLLRQTALAAILAQIGSQVPAQQFILSPVDRIFTRLGGQDDLIGNKSTFFCEMEETQQILQHATDKSLILIDELGRGTSTFDGQALAQAVLMKLTRDGIGKRMIFSTHYHEIQKSVQSQPNIRLCRMACQVSSKKLVYLYKLEDGACFNSFGVNVARAAGLPCQVLEKASQMCEWFIEKA